MSKAAAYFIIRHSREGGERSDLKVNPSPDVA
jgi:hypothetical protein